MSSISLQDLQGAIAHTREIMDAQRDELIRIDGEMGDGDLGITMAKAFKAADEFMGSQEAGDLGKTLMQMGMQMNKAAPSTMGTLLATGFMRGGKAVQGKEELSVADMAELFDAFVNGLMERGKSKPGDKTIIDVMQPVAESLKNAGDVSPADAFAAAYAPLPRASRRPRTCRPSTGAPPTTRRRPSASPIPAAPPASTSCRGSRSTSSRRGDAPPVFARAPAAAAAPHPPGKAKYPPRPTVKSQKP